MHQCGPVDLSRRRRRRKIRRVGDTFHEIPLGATNTPRISSSRRLLPNEIENTFIVGFRASAYPRFIAAARNARLNISTRWICRTHATSSRSNKLMTDINKVRYRRLQCKSRNRSRGQFLLVTPLFSRLHPYLCAPLEIPVSPCP